MRSRSRRSNPTWRIAKKAIVLVTFLIGLRLAWITFVSGWSPTGSVVDVQINDYSVQELQRWTSHQKTSDAVDLDDTSDEVHNDILEMGMQKHKPVIKATAKDKTLNKVSSVKQQDERKQTIKPVTHKKTSDTKLVDSKKEILRNPNDILKQSNKYTKHDNTFKTLSDGRHTVYQKQGTQKQPGRPSSGAAVPHSRVCTNQEPWGKQKYHAQMSTFDLVKEANYTTDESGNYYIPTRHAADIVNDKSLDHVTVILVPFSHADPGYGMTMESYYTARTRATLTNMIDKLVRYPNMTFQWVETVFLSRWFEDLNDNEKVTVRKLVRRGQLEIVLGGWVMPDEASTHYVSVVDQLIEGHQWLIENLHVKPKNAWVNDPFGYSSTMPYLWKSSGMDNMVFLRIDQPLKAVLMKRKSLDFKWRPYWKKDNSSDILATLMPYTNYWIADVCGPNPDVCNEFGFINQGYNNLVVEVTDDNVAVQARKLYEQLRVTADLYKYKTVYLGLGEDFSFTRGSDWDNLHANYKKLISYIDSQKDWKMSIKFGTLVDYFANVRSTQEKMAKVSGQSPDSPAAFPTLSGDFFPYTEKKNEYWTGYFSTRPINKRFSRDIESLVTAADVFNVITYSMFKHYKVQYTGYDNVTFYLRTARRELGMFLHHDGITGTSLPFVVEDFQRRLMIAFEAVNTAFKTVLTAILSKGRHQVSTLLLEDNVKFNDTAIIRQAIIDVTRQNKIVLINSLPRKRTDIVSVFVTRNELEIENPKKQTVPFQITSFPEISKYVRITFPVELPAFGIEVYKLKLQTKSKRSQDIREVTLPNSEAKTFSINNDFLTAYFDSQTGMLKHVTDKTGRTTKMAAMFYVYRASGSGAYIFGPTGPAEVLKNGNVTIKVVKGFLMSEVKINAPGIFQSVRLYNTTSLQGQGIHITTEIDMAAIDLKEQEVVLRFDTDLKNGHNFFTDQNGYQLMGRKTNPDKKIEANFYPISTMAVLEDKNKRFTLHSKEAHGVAALSEGQLEVMLDRHSMRDDGRGLGQGYFQTVNVNSDFVIYIEHKTSPKPIDEVRYTYPTQESSLLNELVQNNIIIYTAIDDKAITLSKVHPIKSSEFPCDVSLVGMRNLAKNDLTYNGTSLVLHRKQFQCGYQSVIQCSNNSKLTVKDLLPKMKVDIAETTLSHLDTKQTLTRTTDLTPEPMELRAFRIQV